MLSVRGARLIFSEGRLDHDTVKKVHFGGFSDDEEEKEDEVYHDDSLTSCRSPNQHCSPIEKSLKLKSWPKLSPRARHTRYALVRVRGTTR